MKLKIYERLIIFIGVLALIISLIPIAFYISKFGIRISNGHDIWAQAGDFFGGILNPIFGFFSFFALLITLVIQIKELKATVQELSDTKEIHSKVVT